MSVPYPRDSESSLSLIAFDDTLLNKAGEEARNSPRGRSAIRLHEHGEPVQRMLNAVEPGSYVSPHRHNTPPKPEAFVALRGSALVARFGDDGAPIEGTIVSADGPCRGVEIPPGAWHCMVSLEEGTVLFEISQGPYDASTHKEFAPWAPREEDYESGLAYMVELKRVFEPVLPTLSAYNMIEAEEDDLC
ncbi:MAG: WbuC family cupin fold metalloprotein [Chloroflexota bacterium]|nr:WbuC family cupin fold metalloprotein [Chloroflexota bacterium]